MNKIIPQERRRHNKTSKQDYFFKRKHRLIINVSAWLFCSFGGGNFSFVLSEARVFRVRVRRAAPPETRTYEPTVATISNRPDRELNACLIT